MPSTTTRQQDATTEVVALLNQSKASLGERPNKRRTEEQLVNNRRVGGKKRKLNKEMDPTAECEGGLLPQMTYSLEASPFDAVPSRKDVDSDNFTSTPRQTRSKVQIGNPSKQQACLQLGNGNVRRLRNLPSRRAVPDLVGDESPHLLAGKRYNLRQQVTEPKLVSGSDHLSQSAIETANIGYPIPEKSSRPKVPRATSARKVAPAPAHKEHKVIKQAGKLPRKSVDQQSNDGSEQNGGEDDEQGQDDKRDKDYTGDDQDHGDEDDDEDKKVEAERATELHGCFELWKDAWDAAQKTRQNSMSPTNQVSELQRAMRLLEKQLLQKKPETNPEVEEVEAEAAADEEKDDDDKEDNKAGALPRMEGWDLDKITPTMKKLEERLSSSKGAPLTKLRHDICRRAIPRAVLFARRVLISRATSGRLSMSALEELCQLLTATRGLCTSVMLNLKPDEAESLKGIKRSLRKAEFSLLKIEQKYRAAISKHRTENYNALARIREKELADSRAREQEERRLRRPADRQNRVNSIWQAVADRQQHMFTSHADLHEPERHSSPLAESEVYDVDDLGLPETTPTPSHLFHRAPTEDIPGPPKRLWRIEETLALSFLLLHYRDADRYERIHEQIGQFSRHIRQAGGENILSMSEEDIVKVDLLAGDTLDELGNMDVAEIEEHANYLKAMQVGGLEMPIRNGGQRGNWASLAGV
jgi:hypothetical protein